METAACLGILLIISTLVSVFTALITWLVARGGGHDQEEPW